MQYQTYNSKRRKLLSSILFFSVLLVVVLIALYLTLKPTTIQLSPGGGNYLDADNSRSILTAIGITKKGNNPASTWFRSQGTKEFKDAQGNTYGKEQYLQLAALLDQKVIKEYSPGFRFKPIPQPSASASASAKVQPSTPTPTPTISANPAASASGSP